MEKKKRRPSKPPKIDAAAKRVVSEAKKIPANQSTTGAMQTSFHVAERAGRQEVYEPRFPIVGIGASAGGLEAVSELLAALPVDTGMAFIYIQHLAPDRDSLLPSILGRTTTMPVRLGETDLKIEPNHVYVIPPNTNMGLVHGVLKLLPRLEAGRHMPINFFLRCLADDQRSSSIGVILSGADSDGSDGLRAIRAAGGLTLVQDPMSARVPGMPRSAIAAEAADTVLPVREMARELLRLSQHPLARASEVDPQEDSDLKRALWLLKHQTGVDFSFYRKGTVGRRLRRRVLLRNAANLAEYLNRFQADTDEMMDLYDDLLISVTNFFRDAKTFEFIKASLIPKLLAHVPADGIFRMWIAGCATGEEVYSYAIIINEVMDELKLRRGLQIFASDLSERALDVAREGFYLDSVVTDVAPERLRRFFTKASGGYRISPALRESCVFARHDLTRDPPFSRMDLVSCRNLLIYLEPPQQERVLNHLSYALNVHAYLVLGSSETASSSDAFEVVDREAKVFARKAIRPRLSVDVHRVPLARDRAAVPRSRANEGVAELEREVSQILIRRFAPSGVVVTSAMQIVLFQGATAEYLTPPAGEATLNVLRMAKPGLDTELRILLRKCEKTGKAVRKDGIRRREGGAPHAIEVIPLRLNEVNSYYLIVFIPESSPARVEPVPSSPDRVSKETRQLQDELNSTREYLRSIIHEKEVSNEELQAANEEVVSSNEELQSTNEELETAKEELQSTNEELSTVNDELTARNQTLSDTNSDLGNLLANVNLPIMMVGADLRIRRFTPQVERVFRVISTDVGRLITDITLNINLPEVGSLIREVIDRGQMTERVVEDHAKQRYSLRIRPYRAANDRIDGAVLVLVDIGTSEAPDQRSISPVDCNGIDQPCFFLNHQYDVISGNAATRRFLQFQDHEIVGQNFFEMLDGAWNQPMLKSLIAGVLLRKEILENYRVDGAFGPLGRQAFSLSARRTSVQGSTAVMILLEPLGA